MKTLAIPLLPPVTMVVSEPIIAPMADVATVVPVVTSADELQILKLARVCVRHLQTVCFYAMRGGMRGGMYSTQHTSVTESLSCVTRFKPSVMMNRVKCVNTYFCT